MFARSCGTLLSTPTLVMILKHNNTQHRLTVEETEAYIHTPVVTAVMMIASVFLLLVPFGTFMNIMFTHGHGKFTRFID